MEEIIFSPSEFVAVFNQTLEYAYPNVVIEGELTNFRIAKNRWVYFDLKDEAASLRFFGTVYQLPGPLQDGLKLRVVGVPRLHPKFGFTVNIISLLPVGEGSIKQAADLLRTKLAAEGLFDEERKRSLPAIPRRLGLVTAADSAACADFLKILNSRWGGVDVLLADCLVQGDQAPIAVIAAVEYLNQLPNLPDVIVVTRGGGSAEDLAAFNDERLVRAVAASRVPTLIGVGHETDFSLAELAADRRASTPTNAAQLVVPDKEGERRQLLDIRSSLEKNLTNMTAKEINYLTNERRYLTSQVSGVFATTARNLDSARKVVSLFNPAAALKRGYAIVKKGSQYIISTKQVSSGDKLSIQLSDGKIKAVVQGELK